MRHAEFSSNPLGAIAPTAPTRPTTAIGGAGASFARTFAEVQSEVATFIRDGGSMELSPEGSAWRARGMADASVLGAGAVADLAGLTVENEGGDMMGATPQQQAFLASIAPWAREAADKLGVAPELVSAHAALESAWGQRPIPGAKGTSHNLFGIKAGGAWTGAVSETTTTEYVQGQAISTRERFRAYPDAAGAFRDYARMLLDNPRYKGALNVGSDAQAFAQGLARGGYATDPAYAAKLARLANQLQGTKG